MVMLGYIAEKALELQVALPEIADDWVNRNIFQKKIAEDRGLVDFLDIKGKDPENTATSVVRAALRGFEDVGNIKGFSGLVNRDVYVEVSRRHRQAILDKYNREDQGSLVNMDKKTLREISERGVRARGRIPISDAEKEFVYECSGSPEYMTSQGISWVKISEEVNSKFGNGRTKKAVRCMVYKEKA